MPSPSLESDNPFSPRSVGNSHSPGLSALSLQPFAPPVNYAQLELDTPKLQSDENYVATNFPFTFATPTSTTEIPQLSTETTGPPPLTPSGVSTTGTEEASVAALKYTKIDFDKTMALSIASAGGASAGLVLDHPPSSFSSGASQPSTAHGTRRTRHDSVVHP